MMDFIMSPYLAIPTIAWLAAQTIKYLLLSFSKKGNFKNYKLLYASGGMPSSHSALVISLLVVVATLDGVRSAVFGLAWVLAAVVVYDAVNVRRAVGEQGKVLRRLLDGEKAESFFSAKGHTLLEVTAGSVLGAAVALLLLRLL